jgi:hypothetical protein
MEILRQGRTPARIEAAEYLNKCFDLITDEMDRQKNGKSPQPLRFPEATPDQLEAFKLSLGNIREYREEAQGMLEISQEDIRVLIDIEQGSGVITFIPTVPKELDNIVVLDASHVIRKLAQDPSIKRAGLPANMVNYQNVTVHQCFYPSGRNRMTKEFGKRRNSRKVTREIAEYIKDRPEDEAFLIFVFKEKFNRVKFRRILESDLKANGVDTNATVTLEDGTEKPRFVVLTWGNETSISHYSYCKNVVFAGVLHRSHLDIGSSIAALNEDLLMTITNKEIRETIQSEVLHCIYQALSRGSCRVIDQGIASPMNVFLLHLDPIQHEMRRVMPGVNWKTWEPRHLASKAKVDSLAIKLLDYLESLNGTEKVSTTEVKRALELTDVPSRTFTRAIKQACNWSLEWDLEKQSVVRHPLFADETKSALTG